MSERVRRGTVRPGGRTARVRQAVMVATEDAIVERGFSGVDLADIARRSGVGRATVYRRWGSRSELVADLLADMAEQSLPRARTGTLQGDLRANARLVRRTLADKRQGAIFKAVIASATSDSRTAQALQGFYNARISEWAPCVEEAVERGEVPAGTVPYQVIAAVSAPLYYRFLLTQEPLDLTAADRAADAALAAARAGAYST